MMDRSNSQYDSFLFWRQPIPELDLSELEDLGLLEQPARSTAGWDASPPARRQDQEEGEEVRQFTQACISSWQPQQHQVSSDLSPPLSPPPPLQDLLSEFSSFTFWRAPLADVDSLLADLHLLL